MTTTKLDRVLQECVRQNGDRMSVYVRLAELTS